MIQLDLDTMEQLKKNLELFVSTVYRHVLSNQLYRLYRVSPPKMTGSFLVVEEYHPKIRAPGLFSNETTRLSDDGYYSLKNLRPAFEE